MNTSWEASSEGKQVKHRMNDMKFVELHVERVAYREAGSGEVVVLIHGMAGSSDTRQAVVPQLARHYRVIAPVSVVT